MLNQIPFMNNTSTMLQGRVLELPKFDKGIFYCYIDTEKDFSYLLKYLFEDKKSSKKYIIIDDGLQGSYDFLIKKINRSDNAKIIYASSTEDNKSFKNIEKILHEILNTLPSKEDIIVCIGGGIIMNMGGFIAGLLLRGMNLVHVPTTLSSQTDVFLGGKQAINFLGFKNQIGLFKDPEICYININFLSTISSKDLRYQLVEGLKLCLTSDKELFWKYYNLIDNVEELTQTDTCLLIEEFINIKAPLVKADPYEKNIGLCNVYGHTLGHAIEMSSNGNMSHCEAVGLGMLLAAKLSFNMNIAEEDVVAVHIDLLNKLQIPITVPSEISVEEIFRHLKHDKKNIQGKIPFVLLKKIGVIAMHNNDYYHLVPEEQIRSVLIENH